MTSEMEMVEEIYSNNEERLGLIDTIIRFFEQNNFQPAIDHYELYLVLDEAITNAIEHGNKWDKNKKVKAQVQFDQNKSASITISDEGPGFNPQEIPGPTVNKENLSPRGRGIFIIKKFCKTTWNEKGNSITLSVGVNRKTDK